MDGFFYHIYRAVQKNKIAACAIALLFLIGCGTLALRLTFEEDITQIIPKDERTGRISKALKQVNFADKITILVEKGDTISSSVLTEAAAKLTDSLQRDTLYIKHITGRIGTEEMTSAFDFVYQNLPLFLDREDYTVVQDKLSPSAIAEQVAQNYRTLISPTGIITGNFLQRDPLGITALGLKKIQRQAVGDRFTLYDGFIVSRDTTKLLLFLEPVYQGADTEHNTALVQRIRQVCGQLQAAYASRLTISYYGAAPIAVANAEQIKKDISTTVLVSTSVLMLLLVLFYRNMYIPILVFIPTVFSVLLAVACLYLYKPVISAISLSIGAVLLGITIDYTLHILTHFKKSGDVRELYRELTRPLLMSGATNAVAFLCLLFVHSEALVDLGIFASICIFSSAIFTLIITPHLYRPKKAIQYRSVIDRLASFPFERSRILLGCCLVLIVASFFTGGSVTYNNNIADLNFVPDDLREVEEKLDRLTNASSKSIYLVATGAHFEEAARQADKLVPLLNEAKRQGEIIDFSGANAMPLSREQQVAKIDYWQRFWSAGRRERVIGGLQEAGEQYGFTAEAHRPFYELLKYQHKPVTLEVPGTHQVLGLTDYVAERDGFYTIATLVKLDESKREAFLKRMTAFPEILLIDRQNLNETFLGQLRNDFNRLVGYSFFAVLFILWIFFRRIELVLLSAIPIGLTGLVTAGIMGAFGLEFNIFSAIVCTLVFGHGVDFSIFMTAALQKQYSTGKDELQTYRTSILLAVLTTILAIGALIFAKHPALLSIAFVSLIGVFAAVIITFVFYPLLFQFFISIRAKQGKSPFTLKILFFSLLFFAYYGLGCLVLSILYRGCLRFFPWSAEKKDAAFRKTMSAFMKSVLYLHPLTKVKTLNPYGETFEKPAVIIANHSSFLDTLSLGMLVPKGIFLVNDWVWNSPVFGRAVKALGFYPVSSGLNEGLGYLREKVNQGYSLIVFPEGTRSYDNTLKRFHKGAFYLAEQFEIDVLPVYLLGNGDVLPKGDILIFGGKLTSVIGKRIDKSDETYGVGYAERTKQIARAFRKAYAAWRHKVEDRYYFQKKITLAYLYKDEEIVARVKRNIKDFAALYRELDRYLSDGLKVFHFSDTYGELDYLLSLLNGNRKINGVILDEAKRAVAASIYWVQQRQIRFQETIADHVEILVLHPEIEIATIPLGLLESVKEIYTFKEEPLLVTEGWTKSQLSDLLIRYNR